MKTAVTIIKTIIVATIITMIMQIMITKITTAITTILIIVGITITTTTAIINNTHTNKEGARRRVPSLLVCANNKRANAYRKDVATYS